jgi:hypothetical protein
VKFLEVHTYVMKKHARRSQFAEEAGKKKEGKAYQSDEI